MLKIATKTKLTPEETTARAKDFFGPGGYGMSITDETPTSVCFEGGGGGVEIGACAEDGGSGVDFVSREWDFQVTEFIARIG